MRRRGLLKLGVASAAVFALAGGSLALMQRGVNASRLSPAGREVFGAVALAVLDGTLPTESAPRTQAVAGLLDRIDGLVAALPNHAQQELSQLLALLASAPGRIALAGLQQPWAVAQVQEIQQSLQMMRRSAIGLRQQAYQAFTTSWAARISPTPPLGLCWAIPVRPRS